MRMEIIELSRTNEASRLQLIFLSLNIFFVYHGADPFASDLLGMYILSCCHTGKSDFSDKGNCLLTLV